MDLPFEVLKCELRSWFLQNSFYSNDECLEQLANFKNLRFTISGVIELCAVVFLLLVLLVIHFICFTLGLFYDYFILSYCLYFLFMEIIVFPSNSM